MANTIKLRRSATAGAVPTTAQLSLGELAINTTDGKMYLKKDVSGTETIVQIGGSIAIAGSPPADASAGDIYWDEDDGSAYIYYDDGNGAAQWVPLTETIIPGSEVRKLDDISSSFDGIETVFSLTLNTNAHTPAYQNGVFVSIGGVIQEPETDFTITGDQITFTTAPTSGLSFFAVDIGVVNPIGTPSDGTVTPAKLSAGGPSWDASSNLTIDGKVGVGTSDAHTILTVREPSTGAKIALTTGQNTPSSVQGIDFYDRQGSGGFPSSPGQLTSYIRSARSSTTGNFTLTFGTANSLTTDAEERLRITPDGNVGIGTQSPGSKLEIEGIDAEDLLHLSTGNTAGDTFAQIRGDNEAGIRIRGGGSIEGGTIELGGGLRDTDPGIIKFSTGTSGSSTEAARIDTSGRLLVGTSTARTNFSLSSTGVHDGLVQYETTSEPLGLSLCRNSSGNPIYLSLSATGGSSIGSTAPVSDDDGLGSIVFSGMNGLGAFSTAALISAEVDAAITASTSEMPGRLVFSTTADGDPSPTERMRIDSSGNVGIGTDNPTNATLHVEGRNFSFGGPGDNVTGEGNFYIGNYNNPLLDPWERNVTISSSNEIQIRLYTDWDGTQYSQSELFSSPEGLGLQFNGNKGGVNRSLIFPLNYHAGTAITDDYLFFQAGNKYLWFDADTGRLGINRPSGSGWTDTLDVNGTARVTGIATFDSNVTITGSVTSEGSAVATVGNNQTFTKAQRGGVVTLTDGATITPDFAAGNNFAVTIAGNRTLNNPSNITPGQSGVIVITHSGTNRTLSYGSYYKFSNGITPSLSATSGAVDVLSYYVATTSFIVLTLLKGLS